MRACRPWMLWPAHTRDERRCVQGPGAARRQSDAGDERPLVRRRSRRRGAHSCARGCDELWKPPRWRLFSEAQKAAKKPKNDRSESVKVGAICEDFETACNRGEHTHPRRGKKHQTRNRGKKHQARNRKIHDCMVKLYLSSGGQPSSVPFVRINERVRLLHLEANRGSNEFLPCSY